MEKNDIEVKTPINGLTDEEVADRVSRGLINGDQNVKTKSVGKILFSNIFTLFNMIFVAIAVILVICFRRSENSVINAFGWVFLVFLIHEAVMVVGGLVMLLMNIRPGAAELPGKVATFTFYGVMLLIIAFGPDVGVLTSLWTMPDVMTGILVVVAACTCLVAFASYMPETYRQFRDHFREKKAEKAEKVKK